PPAGSPDAPDFAKHVAPLLKKYCAGCHNADDADGDLIMDTFALLMKGGENGAVIKAGDNDASLLIKVLTGKSKPKMPPKDKPAPSADEIAILKKWIDAGAKGPADGTVPTLDVPSIKPLTKKSQPITAVAISPDDQWLAAARFGVIELHAPDLRSVHSIGVRDGKINSLSYSRDGSKLVAATGVAGLYGRAVIIDMKQAKVVSEVQGHRDVMYDAVFSPDGKLLVTCSYDKKIIVWNAETGAMVREIAGHNDAVYDLAFHPDGKVLASASGDHTVKLWRVSDGERLDTLNQPLAEQSAVLFSPDGKQIIAAGADNRIRVWQFISREKPAINPLLHARFAHEGAIVQLAFSREGSRLISAAEDGTIKLWETKGYTQVHAYETQPDVPAALGAWAKRDLFNVGRMDGYFDQFTIKLDATATTDSIADLVPKAIADTAMQMLDEREPNDTPGTAMKVDLPAMIKGVIHNNAKDAASDADFFRFHAKAGEQWILEVNAARSKSPLDSKIEVLDSEGNRIERVRLQAVRDSYFTFRGKDSSTSDDFRVKSWEEMELNEFLYANGEVVKLWHYPRGPDSGFMVYPGSGARYNYFDTTPLSHPLHEPCYIVRPLPAGATPLPNGLPVFPIYFENDDDSNRRFGADSQLTFTAPRDGEYLARLTDVRGFHGEAYKYTLTIRPRRPDFNVSIQGANPKVSAGSGREFTVKVDRLDGYDGEIRVDISGAPPGFRITSPITIEAGQDSAYGAIHALPDAPETTAENSKATKATAKAMVEGKEVFKTVNNLGEIKLEGKPKLLVMILPKDDAKAGSAKPASGEADAPLELTIEPGQTIEAMVRVERNGFDGRVELGGADAGRNMPHGVYVDNIGLSGLLVVEGETERTFFITAASWVKPTSRLFYIRAKVEGVQASWPVLLHVRDGK
ncbi:MAG: c-type cytochrome domain-containing protein, partial [Phycisphaeraceae bacterium]